MVNIMRFKAPVQRDIRRPTRLVLRGRPGRFGEEAGLRLMVVGGGCSGFTYKMGFDENIAEQDKIMDIDGIKLVIDEKSGLYLDAVEVDFQDNLMGKGFVFNNPNASGTCGCGSSFSI